MLHERSSNNPLGPKYLDQLNASSDLALLGDLVIYATLERIDNMFFLSSGGKQNLSRKLIDSRICTYAGFQVSLTTIRLYPRHARRPRPSSRRPSCVSTVRLRSFASLAPVLATLWRSECSHRRQRSLWRRAVLLPSFRGLIPVCFCQRNRMRESRRRIAKWFDK